MEECHYVAGGHRFTPGALDLSGVFNIGAARLAPCIHDGRKLLTRLSPESSDERRASVHHVIVNPPRYANAEVGRTEHSPRSFKELPGGRQ